MDVLTHWVGGELVDWPAGRQGDAYHPATGAVSMRVAYASAADVDRAVGLAAAAGKRGARHPIPQSRAR